MYRTVLASAAAVLTVATSLTAMSAPAAATPPQPGAKAAKLSAPTNTLLSPSGTDLTWQYPGENVTSFEIDPLGRTQPITVPASTLQKDGTVYEYSFAQPSRLPVRVRAITQDGTSSPWSRISRTGWGLDAVVTSSSSVADRTQVRVDTNAPRVEFKFAKPGSKDLTRTVLSRRGQAEVSVKGEWDTVTVRGMGLLKSRVGTASTAVLSRATMFDVTVNTLTGQRVDLAWVTPEGARSATATRTPIDVAGKPTGPAQTVPATLTGLVDATVRPGQAYEYNVTVNFGGQTVATSNIQVQTPDSDGNSFVTQPEVVTAGETTVVTASEPVVVTGADGEPQASITVMLDGAQLELGQGVILPPTESTPQGFMGRVTGVTTAGVTLVSVGVEDLFVELDVSDSVVENYSDEVPAGDQAQASSATAVTPAAYTPEKPSFFAELVRKMVQAAGEQQQGVSDRVVGVAADSGQVSASTLGTAGAAQFTPASDSGYTERTTESGLTVIERTLLLPSLRSGWVSQSGNGTPPAEDAGTSPDGGQSPEENTGEGQDAEAQDTARKTRWKMAPDNGCTLAFNVGDKLVSQDFAQDGITIQRLAAKGSMVVKDGEKYYTSAVDVQARFNTEAEKAVSLTCKSGIKFSGTWMMGPVPFTVVASAEAGFDVELQGASSQGKKLTVRTSTDSRIPHEDWTYDLNLGDAGGLEVEYGTTFRLIGQLDIWAGVGVYFQAGKALQIGAVAGANVVLTAEAGVEVQFGDTVEGGVCLTGGWRVSVSAGLGLMTALTFKLAKLDVSVGGELHAIEGSWTLIDQWGDKGPWNGCPRVPVGDDTQEAPYRIVKQTSGENHTCYLTDRAEVYCFGSNAFGQLGNGTWDSSWLVPVKVKLTGVTELKAAQNTTAAVAGGSVWAWGQGDLGQLGNGKFENSNVPVEVLAPAPAVDLVEDDGQVCVTSTEGILCPSRTSAGSWENRGARITRVISVPVSTGPADSEVSIEIECEANAVGELKCDAGNGIGEVDPDTIDGATSATSNHVCLVRKPSRELVCFGDNRLGQLGNGTVEATAIPTRVVNLGPVEVQRVVGDHTCATTTDGHTFCWGANEDGLLDLAGVGAYSHTPVYCQGDLYAPKCVGGNPPAPVSPTPQPTPGATTPAPQPTPSTEATPQPTPTPTPTRQPQAPGQASVLTSTVGYFDASFTVTATSPDGVGNWEYQLGQGGQWGPWVTANAVTIPVSALAEATQYQFRARAINNVGAGAASEVVEFTTKQASPSAVTGLEAVPGDQVISVEYTVGETGSAPLDRIEYSVNNGAWWTSRSNPVSIEFDSTGTRLANGTAYSVRLRAVNSDGRAGVPSAPLSVTPRTTPDRPTVSNLVRKVGAVELSASVANNGGAEVTAYEYQLNNGEWVRVDATQTAGNKTVINVTGLAPASVYWVSVRAVNEAGAGGSTYFGTFRTLQPPSEPQQLQVYVQPDSLTPTVQFVPATSTEAPITGYEYSLNNGEWRSVTSLSDKVNSAGKLSGVLSGVEFGVTYSVRVRAISDAGAGTPSLWPVSFTPFRQPQAPKDITMTVDDSGYAWLELTVGAYNDSVDLVRVQVSQPGTRQFSIVRNECIWDSSIQAASCIDRTFASGWKTLSVARNGVLPVQGEQVRVNLGHVTQLAGLPEWALQVREPGYLLPSLGAYLDVDVRVQTQNQVRRTWSDVATVQFTSPQGRTECEQGQSAESCPQAVTVTFSATPAFNDTSLFVNGWALCDEWGCTPGGRIWTQVAIDGEAPLAMAPANIEYSTDAGATWLSLPDFEAVASDQAAERTCTEIPNWGQLCNGAWLTGTSQGQNAYSLNLVTHSDGSPLSPRSEFTVQLRLAYPVTDPVTGQTNTTYSEVISGPVSIGEAF